MCARSPSAAPSANNSQHFHPLRQCTRAHAARRQANSAQQFRSSTSHTQHTPSTEKWSNTRPVSWKHTPHAHLTSTCNFATLLGRCYRYHAVLLPLHCRCMLVVPRVCPKPANTTAFRRCRT
ncbi:hypothetical protein TRVL_09510 [Trypanosoma vivax]|nr:hypothetical protein TRVL_09510 [Trypanosoma vivax]